MIRVRRAASLAVAAVTAGLVLGLASPAAAIEPPSGFFGGTLMFCSSSVVLDVSFGCTAPPKPASEYPTAQAARKDAARRGKRAEWCFLAPAGEVGVGVLCHAV